MLLIMVENGPIMSPEAKNNKRMNTLSCPFEQFNFEFSFMKLFF